MRSLTSIVFLGLGVLIAACGSDDTSSTGIIGTGGSGGGGGQGGAGAGLPSQRPQCDDPNAPMGAAPEPRADSAGALSADARSLLVFGGDVATVICGQQPARDHVDDTWILDTACGGWSKLAIAGPAARARHSVIADPSRNRALLFGGRTRPTGQSGAYTLFNDVWAFDFASETWSELTTSGSAPSARANSATVVIGDDMWVFGGNSSTSGLQFIPHNDLYALNLTSGEWRQIGADGNLPPARLFHAMAADPAGRLYIGHGGDENAFLGPFFTDLWGYDVASNRWTELPAALVPGAQEGRIKLGLNFRAGDGSEPGRLLMVAGHDDGTLGNSNDVQSLEIPAGVALDQLPALQWQQTVPGDQFNAPGSGQCDFPADFVLPDLASPERRSAFTFAPHPSGEAFVVFGGDSDCGRLSDAWWYDTRADSWEVVKDTLPGLTCPRTGNPNCQSLCG